MYREENRYSAPWANRPHITSERRKHHRGTKEIIRSVQSFLFNTGVYSLIWSISVNWLLLLSYYSHPDKFSGSYVYYRNNTLSVFSSIFFFQNLLCIFWWIFCLCYLLLQIYIPYLLQLGFQSYLRKLYLLLAIVHVHVLLVS